MARDDSGADQERKSIGPPPSTTTGDVVDAVARAALSAVPVFGGPAAELIGLVIDPALHRRREDWFRRLGEVVDDLRDHQIDVGELSTNDAFVTAVLSASGAAMRTHEEEKLRALQNAVTRTGLALSPEEHTLAMFIRFIDELTGLHLQLLAYSQSPQEWFKAHGVGRPNVIAGARAVMLEAAFPALKDRAAFYGQIFNELAARGLAQNMLSGMVSEQALMDPMITPTGEQFLTFTSDPPPPPDR